MKTFILVALQLLIFSIIYGQNISRFNCDIYFGNEVYENAFTGGLNSPQFNTIDINRNGLSDLVVFDRDGDKLMVFLRDPGDHSSFIFAPQYNEIFPEIKSWMMLVDYNNDGIEDLFTSYSGGIEVWKGLEAGNTVRFEKQSNPNSPEDILTYPLGSYTYHVECLNVDIPVIADLDGDGDVDILSFGLNNSVAYYKNLSAENNISPDSFKFVFSDPCWGKFEEHPLNEEILLSDDPNRCAKWWATIDQRHIGSTILAIDPDGDGIYDLLVGDVGTDYIIYLVNGGNKDRAWITAVEKFFPQYDVPVRLNTFVGMYSIDVDNDGQKDLVLAPNAISDTPFPQTINNIHYYRNEGTGNEDRFKFNQKDFLVNTMINLGGRVYPVFVDLTGNGINDLVVGTSPAIDHDTIMPSRLYFFENRGTKTSPEFHLSDDDFLGFSEISQQKDLYYFTPAFGDMDGDGDPDLLVGNHEGTLIYLENISDENGIKFKPPIYNYQDLNVFSFSAPLIADINRDGILDILIGCGNNYQPSLFENYGSIVYYQNEGSKENPVFNPDPFAYPNTPEFGKIRLSKPFSRRADAVLTFIKDGDDDYLVAGSLEGTIKIFKNPYTAIYEIMVPHNEAYGGIDIGNNSAPALADLNGDGYLEMLIGTSRGGFEFWNTDIKASGGTSTSELYERARIYPNPAQDHIYIDFSENHANDVAASLFDMVGREVIKTKISGTGNKINIGQLSPGTYLLQLRLKDKIINSKIIKTTF